MVFSDIPFLNYFLVALLGLYFVLPRRFKNAALLAASVVFYAFGEPVYVLLMLGTTLTEWAFGLLIDRHRGTRLATFWLIVSLAFGLGLLAFFKYSGFFVENWNALTGGHLPSPGIVLPIGISFYTFQILSYTIDLYRGNTAVQRNPLDFATYVTLFPQLIAGPIVRYADVAAQLGTRTTTLSDFAAGARRFVAGLCKKVLVANVLGELCAAYRDADERSVLFTWLYAVAYALHIYFDFSGYSDMAIGLGRLFGFRFPENFRHPYAARSVTEFWRRWHISLGTWFRDYVYIPLGGNRTHAARHVLNILLVWLLTGLWHGAGWTFILWGLWFALWLLLEKYALARALGRLPALGHVYVLFIVLLSWVLFDAGGLSEALTRIGALFGAGGLPAAGTRSLYLARSYAIPLLVGAIGATPLPHALWHRLESSGARGVLTALEPLACGAGLLLCIAYLVDGSYNPFLYFRF